MSPGANMSFRNDNHSRTRNSSCKDTRGGIFKYAAFLYVHAQLPSGELVAFRTRLSDGHMLRCYQHRLARSACGRQAYPRKRQQCESGSSKWMSMPAQSRHRTRCDEV
jgi:hypothetical protein